MQDLLSGECGFHEKCIRCVPDSFNIESHGDVTGYTQGHRRIITAVGKGNGNIRIITEKGCTFFLVGELKMGKGDIGA